MPQPAEMCGEWCDSSIQLAGCQQFASRLLLLGTFATLASRPGKIIKMQSCLRPWKNHQWWIQGQAKGKKRYTQPIEPLRTPKLATCSGNPVKKMNLGRNMKRVEKVKHIFSGCWFGNCWFGNLGGFVTDDRHRHLTEQLLFPTWSSSWHSRPARIRLTTDRIQSKNCSWPWSTLASSWSSCRNSISTSSPNTSSHLAPLIASCNSSLDKAPLPSLSYCFKWSTTTCASQDCTSSQIGYSSVDLKEWVLSTVQYNPGTDTINGTLCYHHLTGLNFFEMLYQFILFGAAACKGKKKRRKSKTIWKFRKRQQHQACFNKNTPGTSWNFAKHGTSPKPWVLDEMVKRPFLNVLGPPKICQVLADLIADRNRKAQKTNKHIG